MASAELFDTVDLLYCQAVMLEEWNPARGRFFVAYRARHGFTSLIGNGVVDEFRTVSGPILLAPAEILGGVYDVGMLLAELRDVDAPIDTGWPPLTIGIDAPAPALEADWREELLKAMQDQRSRGSAPWSSNRLRGDVAGHALDILRSSLAGETVATVIVTDAALLPSQLQRLTDVDDAAISIAVSKGNRLPYVEEGEFHKVYAVSEARLKELESGLKQLLRE